MNIQHSCRTDQWGTPEWVLQKVRQVLGEIDLDPASSDNFNCRVGAKEYYTEEDNGLCKPWYGSVYCNPPGGLVGSRSRSALFWVKLMEERKNIKHAIHMAFSSEALQNTQNKGVPPMAAFPCCIPSKRIHFINEIGEVCKQPAHSNIIVYVPGRADESKLFVETFREVGAIMRPWS